MISEILGWSYFFVWSFSFYPHVYLNWKLKSCTAISKMLLCLNIFGFFAYLLFTLYSTNLVSLNDKIFAAHALILSSIILIQAWIYDGWQWRYLGVPLVLFILYNISFILLGYIKVFITLIKYMPQIFLNYQRKSTIGYSTESIAMDILGGILSISQLFYDGYVQKLIYSDILRLNSTKVLLSCASILMSLILFTQSVIYRKKTFQEQLSIV
eukprot:NODE_203_length_12996_cov_1.033961.p8 type:complete len:212 gc:universal NODE_203_length_12996_cov_1.033961:7997-7362(-)